MEPARGHVYRADEGFGGKPWLVVSNNRRNRSLDTVIGVRVTMTDRKISLPTIVRLTSADPLAGFVLVDDLEQIYRTELATYLGAVSPRTMQLVSAALRVALP